MINERIFLSSAHLNGTELQYKNKAFVDNWAASVSPNVDNFEKDIENYLNRELYVGGLNSGTAAIHLGLVLLVEQAGDTVLCQSITFSASANPILY